MQMVYEPILDNVLPNVFGFSSELVRASTLQQRPGLNKQINVVTLPVKA